VNVGIREIKNRLSYYLRQVKRGGMIIITERNVPVAKIVPFNKPGINEILSLQEAGLVTWYGGKPEGLNNPLELKGSRLVSEMIAEDRR